MFVLDGTAVPPRAEIGGKAWSIATMRAAGLPVPPAFVLGTSLCAEVLAYGDRGLDGAWAQVEAGIAWLGVEVGRTFGSVAKPLLVSVRSGAPQSMPGMMDTLLNLGITPVTAAPLAAERGEDFAADSSRRLAELWDRLVGGEPPSDPWSQLRLAILAVFRSWTSPRAVAYRRHHQLADDGGTAVTVQAMVFGNAGPDSGTGVVFSRNPLTGADEVYGEWIPCGQGEDLVSGRRTPQPLADLEATMPSVHKELCELTRRWESERADMQDIEFTVEDGRLWILQSRSAKRSPHAAVAVAVSLAREGIVTPADALRLVTADQVRRVLAPGIDPRARSGAELLVTGEPACPGVAVGVGVADSDEAESRAEAGESVVLVRSETSPDDVHGMIAATAVITETGGATSHAAVVCRELGRPAVVGCGEGAIDAIVGRLVTVDGTNGEVFLGEVPCVSGEPKGSEGLAQIAAWIDELGGHEALRAALR